MRYPAPRDFTDARFQKRNSVRPSWLVDFATAQIDSLTVFDFFCRQQRNFFSRRYHDAGFQDLPRCSDRRHSLRADGFTRRKAIDFKKNNWHRRYRSPQGVKPKHDSATFEERRGASSTLHPSSATGPGFPPSAMPLHAPTTRWKSSRWALYRQRNLPSGELKLLEAYVR